MLTVFTWDGRDGMGWTGMVIESGQVYNEHLENGGTDTQKRALDPENGIHDLVNHLVHT